MTNRVWDFVDDLLEAGGGMGRCDPRIRPSACSRGVVPSTSSCGEDRAVSKYVREGNRLVRRENGGTYTLTLPSPDGFTVGYWIKPSPFDGTPPWEWVITNMDVTVVTGMSSGYTFTESSAKLSVRRALQFWASLGYDTVALPN